METSLLSGTSIPPYLFPKTSFSPLQSAHGHRRLNVEALIIVVVLSFQTIATSFLKRFMS